LRGKIVGMVPLPVIERSDARFELSRPQATLADEIGAAAVQHDTFGKISKPARIIIQRKRDATRIRGRDGTVFMSTRIFFSNVLAFIT
jgi:hypothetical protein